MKHRVHHIVALAKVRGANAVRLTYAGGKTEIVAVDYLLFEADRIGHGRAGAWRRRFAPRSPGPPAKRAHGP